ncbi:MAG: transposase [Chloroflexi bacterium]|nr:transposase [Chloroflexota bacterium]
MKRKKYTEEQIIQVLKEGEAGASVADLTRKYGMSGPESFFSGFPHVTLCLSFPAGFRV